MAMAGWRGVSGQTLVTLHGICQHLPGYSNPWWDALHPWTDIFGMGTLGDTRREDSIRAEAVGRFTSVVRPLLQSGTEIDIIREGVDPLRPVRQAGGPLPQTGDEDRDRFPSRQPVSVSYPAARSEAGGPTTVTNLTPDAAVAWSPSRGPRLYAPQGRRYW